MVFLMAEALLQQIEQPSAAEEILTQELRERLLAVGLDPDFALRGEIEKAGLTSVDDLTEENKKLIRRVLELRSELIIDDVTGVLNRQGFLAETARLQSKIARAQAKGINLETMRTTIFAILFFDIDNFKQVNDTYGHGAGNVVLRELAQRIQQSLRPSDFIARWGGDEFVVIARALNGDALKLAERLRQLVGEKPFTVGNGVARPLTISIGAAAYDKDTDEMTKRADWALYGAKGKRDVLDPKGRPLGQRCEKNTICIWDIDRAAPVLYTPGETNLKLDGREHQALSAKRGIADIVNRLRGLLDGARGGG